MDEQIRRSIAEENHESDGSHTQTLLHNAETSPLNTDFSADLNLVIEENN